MNSLSEQKEKNQGRLSPLIYPFSKRERTRAVFHPSSIPSPVTLGDSYVSLSVWWRSDGRDRLAGSSTAAARSCCCRWPRGCVGAADQGDRELGHPGGVGVSLMGCSQLGFLQGLLCAKKELVQ